MLSRALNNPDIPTEKRMSAKDFFDETNEDTFGPAKPKELLSSKDNNSKKSESKFRGSTPEGVSNSSSDEVEWIESSDKKASTSRSSKKSSKKSKKSSKKKHKHKSKKSKRKSSKHSKKKRKRSSTSSSSSGSSSD